MKKKIALAVVVLLAVAALCGALYIKHEENKRMEAEAASLAEAQAAAAAQAESNRLAAEEAARVAAELAAVQAAELAAKEENAAQIKANVGYGDYIGTVSVEGTEVACDLYWGDTGSVFRDGAGCHADDDCVMPGDNGTVFVGAHTDSWFADLKSSEIGSIIHLDTVYGSFEYKITDMQVVGDTEIDKCRWGATEPSCILYTCYPFGIQVPTSQRYLVYADPITTDENGVVPSRLPDITKQA